MTTYIEFINKVKSDKFTPPNHDLVHAAMGLVTEVAEVLELFDTHKQAVDVEGLFDELGDIMWYAHLAAATIGMTDGESDVDDIDEPQDLLDLLVICAADILDNVKKATFYGKEMSISHITDDLNTIYGIVDRIGNEVLGVTVDDIINGNVRKLRARFEDRFTAGEAVNRNVHKEKAALI